MWLSMIDYGRLTWSRTQRKVEKVANNKEKSVKLIKNFKDSWCRKNVLAMWVLDHPQWNLVGSRYALLT